MVDSFPWETAWRERMIAYGLASRHYGYHLAHIWDWARLNYNATTQPTRPSKHAEGQRLRPSGD